MKRTATATAQKKKPKGFRIVEARQSKGLSQVELARAARVTQQMISKVEVLGSVPHLEIAERIAQTLDREIADLFPDAAMTS